MLRIDRFSEVERFLEKSGEYRKYIKQNYSPASPPVTYSSIHHKDENMDWVETCLTHCISFLLLL